MSVPTPLRGHNTRGRQRNLALGPVQAGAWGARLRPHVAVRALERPLTDARVGLADAVVRAGEPLGTEALVAEGPGVALWAGALRSEGAVREERVGGLGRGPHSGLSL